MMIIVTGVMIEKILIYHYYYNVNDNDDNNYNMIRNNHKLANATLKSIIKEQFIFILINVLSSADVSIYYWLPIEGNGLLHVGHGCDITDEYSSLLRRVDLLLVYLRFRSR